MEKTYNISLNVSNKNGVFPLFRVVQGDNITRKIVASLYDENGDAYTPGTGVTAEYWSQKPDRTGTNHSATLSESTVTITLTEQDTAAVGDVYATVKLTKNEEVLSAIPFRFKVEAFPTGDNVPSTSDYQTLVEATEAAEQATADAQAATTAAEQATEYATEAADTASNYNIALLAEGYDATAIYVTGDYCIYQGALYRCLTDILTPEAWTASHWLAVELGADVAEAQRDATEGYSDTLTAGDLTSDEYAEDTEPYLFRRSFNGANNHAMDTLVGGTVAWNQLVQNGNFNGTTNWTTSNCSLSVDNNIGSFTATATNGLIRHSTRTISGHIALVFADVKASSTSVNLDYANNKKYITQTNQFETLYVFGLMTNNGTAYFPRIVDGRSSGWDEVQVRNVMVFDLTQMFGSTIADAIYAMEQAESGSGVAWFRRYFPESFYSYDAGTLKSVEAVAHRMTGKNLYNHTVGNLTTNGITFVKHSDDSISLTGTATSNAYYNMSNYVFPAGTYTITGCPANGSASTYALNVVNVNTNITVANDVGSGSTFTANGTDTYRPYIRIQSGTNTDGLVFKPMIRYADVSDATYKPYEQHTYKLSPLTLRGITKLTDGKLVYDGDTYEPSGQVVRRYGVVTPTACLSSYARTNGDRVGIIARNGYVIDNNTISNTKCNILPTVGANAQYASDYSSVSINDTGNVLICIAGITTHADLNAWLASNNVSVVYELATPTTETASPYEPTQVVYADGTEEYISQNIVPVGHVTKYPVSIKQALTQIAKTPSVNGTYILQCVVTDGVASYSWVTE